MSLYNIYIYLHKILTRDRDLHNITRQQGAHLHHDVEPEEGAADALRPDFCFVLFCFACCSFGAAPLTFVRVAVCLVDT